MVGLRWLRFKNIILGMVHLSSGVYFFDGICTGDSFQSIYKVETRTVRLYDVSETVFLLG